MKKTILLLTLLFVFFLANAQSLTTNTGFHEVNICKKYHENCSPKGWRSTSNKLFGYREGRQRGKYIRLLVFNGAKKNDRKFAQTDLLCPLEKGKEYLISFKVRPDQFKLEAIGILFTEEMLFAKELALNNYAESCVNIPLPKQLKEGEWIQVEYNYVAKGNEKTLIFGNLLTDELTKNNPFNEKQYKKYLKSYGPKQRIEYDFDDVKIIPLDGKINCDIEIIRKHLYQDSIRHSMRRKPVVVLEKSIAKPLKKEGKNIKTEPELKFTSSSPVTPTPLEIPKVIVLQNLEFEFNQWGLKEAAKSDIDKIFEVLKNHPELSIEIVGHTDNIGKEKDNQILSEKRSQSVKEYLISRGIQADRMTVLGKGEIEPIADNNIEEGRQMNRRVEIKIE